MVLIITGAGINIACNFLEQIKEKERYENDETPPVSMIISPLSGTWHSDDFQIKVIDEDRGSGLKTCQYLVGAIGPNGEEVVSGWKERKCNTPQTISVGPGEEACFEGRKSCWVYVRTQDKAGNWYSPSQRDSSIVFYHINFTTSTTA